MARIPRVITEIAESVTKSTQGWKMINPSKSSMDEMSDLINDLAKEKRNSSLIQKKINTDPNHGNIKKYLEKEAHYKEMQSFIKEGQGGQGYLDFGGMSEPSSIAKAADTSEVVNKAVQIDGQQNLMVDPNGYVRSPESVEKLRNRTLKQKRLDDNIEAKARKAHDKAENKIVKAQEKIRNAEVNNAYKQAKAEYASINNGKKFNKTKQEFYEGYKYKTRPYEPRPYDGMSYNADDYTDILGTAEEVVDNVENKNFLSSIGSAVHDHPFVAAGIATGVGFGAAVLFDDDEDEY